MNLQIAALLFPALIIANLPFMTRRLFGFFAIPKKTFFFELLEWLVYLLLMAGLAYWLESRTAPVHVQNWPFYVTVIALFLVFAFPGFVYRYFWRKRM